MKLFSMIFGTGLLVLLLAYPSAPTTHSQPPEPAFPLDLLFTSYRQDFYGIARLDHRTHTAIPFFEPAAGSPRALSWSPHGNFLAIALFLGEEGDDLCILKRDGSLHHCFQDLPTGYEGLSIEQHVTWPADEANIYFLQEVEGQVQLVAGDIERGTIERVIYQYPNEGLGSPIVEWTPDLRYVLMEISDSEQEQEAAVVILDLHTNERLNLATVIARHDQDLQKPDYVCGFSPQGTYITLVVDDRLLVLNLVGEVVYDVAQLRPTCPTWHADETAVYFTRWVDNPLDPGRELGRYSFSEGEWVPVFWIGFAVNFGHLALDRTGRFMALAIGFGHIVVVDLEGNTVWLDEMSEVASRPLWVPSTPNRDES